MTWRLPKKAVWLVVVGASLIAAERTIAQPLDISGECDADSLAAARDLFHRTLFEEADDRLNAYLGVCPESALAQAYSAIVDGLLFRDNSSSARTAEDLARDSSGGIRLMALALTSFAEGELAEAESTLLEFLETHPDEPYASHVLGFTLVDQGRPGEGKIVLERLLEKHPDYFPAYNHLAYAQLMGGDNEAAMATADAFVEADAANPSAWDTRGHILWESGRREEAIASMARAVVLDERFAYGLRHLGDMLLEVGDVDAAATAWERARLSASIADYGDAFNTSLNERVGDLSK